MQKLRIRHVHPDDLTPAPYNPRFWTDDELERLKTGLRKFGLVQPSIVNTRTGWLVGGHMRREACLELLAEGDTRFESVPIVERDLDAEEEKALNILLNNPKAQGSFGHDDLAGVLDTLAETPLLELTGFSYTDYQHLQEETAEDLKAGREGTVPELPTNPISKPGQTWRLGQHLLHIGDATHDPAYQHLPTQAAMTFTDPPYNVDYTGGTAAALKIAGDNQTDAGYEEFLTDALHNITDRTDGAIYLCYAISQATAVHAAATRAKMYTSTTIAWVKDRWVLSRSDYHNQWEGILYGWPQGKPHYYIDDRTQGNVWEHNRPKRDDTGTRKRTKQSDVWRHKRPAASRLHPTMKPVSLVEHAIRNSSLRGEWILDPFGGSGSTLIAAENLGRRCYMIELDPAYADVIIARYASISTTDPEEIT